MRETVEGFKEDEKGKRRTVSSSAMAMARCDSIWLKSLERSCLWCISFFVCFFFSATYALDTEIFRCHGPVPPFQHKQHYDRQVSDAE